MQADLTRYDVPVTYDDNLIQRPSVPRDNSLGQIGEEQEANGDDLDEDSYAEGTTYDDQAAALQDQDFQMNLDDM